MGSHNSITLVGYLGADPEVRSTTDGSRVASFSLATSEKWTDDHGQQRERTEWHRCIAWNNGARTLANLVERYTKKGDQLLVVGSLRYREWASTTGDTHTSAEVYVKEITFLTSKNKKHDSAAAGAAENSPTQRAR
jgi:single-strand DNA-binding protein